MIYVDRSIPLLPTLLEPLDEVRTFEHSALKPEDLLTNDVTALFFRSTLQVTTELLHKTPVRFLGSVTSGIDHIAPQIINDARYTIATAAGANANAVAEYVIASVLMWCNNHHCALQEQSIGIIGFGNIGRRVAAYMKKLGVTVFINDPPLYDQCFKFPAGMHYISLDELIQTCTIISNHVPLVFTGSYPTWHLFHNTLLQQGKLRLFIHTSRGGVISQRLLQRMSYRGIDLAIDVWENEPDCSPTLVQRALIATPHIAGHTIHARLFGALIIARRYYEYYGAQFAPCSLNLPPRQFLSAVEDTRLILSRIMESRKFDSDTEHLRALARLPHGKRIHAIEHFRNTYPPRYEVYRTEFDPQ